MKRRAFPKIEIDPELEKLEPPKERSSLGGRGFGIIKFILGLILLPFVYSTSVVFLSELGLIDKSLQNNFWSGIISFLIIYLFIWEPTVIYTKGHRLLEAVFKFFKPFVKLAPYLVPIYTIILIIVYKLLSVIIRPAGLINYTVFLLGFTIALHLIFSAKAIRAKKSGFLKGDYIFGFSFVYITNLILLAFCLNLIFENFSFVIFFNKSFQIARNMFEAVFKQLFL